MTYFEVYTRVLQMVRSERFLAIALIFANTIIAALSLAEPFILGKMIDVFSDAKAPPGGGGIHTAASLFLLWAILGFLTVGISFVTGLYADKLGHRLRILAINKFTTHAVQLSIPYHDRNPRSQAFQTLLEGINTLWILWFSFFRENCASFVLLLLLCPATIFINWRLSIPFVLLIVATYVLFSVSLIQAEKMQTEAESKNSQMLGRAADILSHVKLVQAFSKIQEEISGLAQLQKGFLQTQEPLLAFWAMIVTASRAASLLSMLLIFGCGFWLNTRNQASIGEIVGFAMIAQIAISRLDAVSIFLSTIFQQKVKLEKFFEVLEEKIPYVLDGPPIPYQRLLGEIVFDNVSFTYPNGNEALKRISFKIEPGTLTALVGRSGSGKTTLLSLICRFYEPNEGRILIDGVNRPGFAGGRLV